MIGRWFRLRARRAIVGDGVDRFGALRKSGASVYMVFTGGHGDRLAIVRARLKLAQPRCARLGLRSLLVDSALGGFWIAVMQFNVLPSVAISVMVICDKIVAGGRVLTIRGLIVQVAACVLTMAVHGFAFSPFTTMAEILATLPLLTLYPLALGTTMRAQSRRLGESMRVPAPLEAARQRDTNLSAT